MQHQQFARAEIAAPMPGSVRHLHHPSTTRQALGCHNKDCLLSPPQHVASSTRLCAAYPLAGWLPAVMVMVMTHLALGLGDKSLSQKIPAEPLVPGNLHGHKHSRETTHTGATWIWTFQTPRLAGKLFVASGCLNYSHFGAPHGAALALSQSTALEAGHRHYCALCVLVVWYHFSPASSIKAGRDHKRALIVR